MRDPSGIPISRRSLLAGAATGVVLAACGSDGADEASGGAVDDGAGLALVRFFDDPSIVAGASRRLVFGLAQADGTLRTDGPDTLAAELISPAGSLLGNVTGTRRAKDLTRQYFQFRVDVPDTGIYTLRTRSGGEAAESSFSVAGPGELPFPGPGESMPPFDSPTTADPGGVNPLCTRQPACTFHDRTLRGALEAGKPVAYLVGTPAHCQTGVCGPMLDVMLSVRDRYPSVTFVHVEVFADDAATQVAPAVEALGLTFEPVLFLIGTDGMIADRLDVVFDATELSERLDALVA